MTKVKNGVDVVEHHVGRSSKLDFDPWVYKCLSCMHSYHTKNDADEIRCRCRNGICNYTGNPESG